MNFGLVRVVARKAFLWDRKLIGYFVENTQEIGIGAGVNLELSLFVHDSIQIY